MFEIYLKFCIFQDFVNLKAEIYYPNLHLESNLVDFECIFNNTESTHYINMSNIGPLPVNYRWSFVVDENTLVERINPSKFMQKSILYSDDDDIKPIEEDVLVEEADDVPKIEIIKDDQNETLVSNSASDILLLINQQQQPNTSRKLLNQKLEQLVQQDNVAELPSYEEVLKFLLWSLILILIFSLGF